MRPLITLPNKSSPGSTWHPKLYPLRKTLAPKMRIFTEITFNFFTSANWVFVFVFHTVYATISNEKKGTVECYFFKSDDISKQNVNILVSLRGFVHEFRFFLHELT